MKDGGGFGVVFVLVLVTSPAASRVDVSLSVRRSKYVLDVDILREVYKRNSQNEMLLNRYDGVWKD